MSMYTVEQDKSGGYLVYGETADRKWVVWESTREEAIAAARIVRQRLFIARRRDNDRRTD